MRLATSAQVIQHIICSLLSKALALDEAYHALYPVSTMKFFGFFTLGLASTFVQSIYAATTPCKKDACYKAIAIQNVNNPNLSKRRADCHAALKLVVDDDVKTITETAYQTQITSTVTITTVRGYSQPTIVARMVDEGNDCGNTNEAVAELEERDLIIVKGAVPKYAKACRNIQAYAIACLCFGVKAQAYKSYTTTTVTTKVVEVATTTTTTGFIPTCTPNSFLLRIGDGDGEYAVLASDGNILYGEIRGTRDPFTATVFYMRSSNQLAAGPCDDPSVPGELKSDRQAVFTFYFRAVSDYGPFYTPSTCQNNGPGAPLSCQNPRTGRSVFVECTDPDRPDLPYIALLSGVNDPAVTMDQTCVVKDLFPVYFPLTL